MPGFVHFNEGKFVCSVTQRKIDRIQLKQKLNEDEAVHI